ncbi:MAG: hypothetical protein IJI74_06560 [Firmicutes bacterium]|nr:hypothetical protein [Bacillota bacterium]
MRKRIAVLLTAAAVLLAAGAAFASTNGTKIFHNRIGTSHVQVQVEQLQRTNEGLTEIDSSQPVMPGEKCSYIPRVTVTGRDSYVRLQFEAMMNEDSSTSISAEDVYGLNEDWVRKGNRFYCRNVIRTGEYSDVFEGIKIPQMENGAGCTGFRVKVTADAIQSENFAPDFESNEPWGSVSIEASAEHGTVRSRAASSVETKTMEFRENNSIECPPEDLFDGFGELVAGDVRSDHLTLTNRSNVKRKVLFRTETVPSELLQQIRLRIRCGKRFTYEGSLDSQDLSDPVTCAVLDPGQSIDFCYSLQLPETADNRFQESAEDVMWIFETKKVRNTTPGKAVKTGDDAWRKVGFAILICLLMLVIILCLHKGKKNEKSAIRNR